MSLALQALGPLVLERPLALVLLLVALAGLLAERRLARAEPTATATLELWRRAARAAGGAGLPARRKPPAWRLWCAAAFACGVLSLAGPSCAREEVGRELLCVVDTSPSMHLPLDPARPELGTRLEHALARLRAELARSGAASPRLVWRTERARGGALEERGAEPPAAWLVPPRAHAPEPPWDELDREGSVWLTDRAREARHAGLVASGGAAVPGAIGRAEGRELVWDGARVLPGRALAPERVASSGATPAPLSAFVEAWCGARGLERVGEGGELALSIEGARADSPALGEARLVGRDGWRARARLAAEGAAGDGEPWLVADGRALVRFEPGRVTHAFLSLELEPGEAPEAFALSFAALFDRARLSAPESVPLRERLAAGEPAFRAPLPRPLAGAPPLALASGFAALGALLGLGALAALVRRAPRRSPALARPPVPAGGS